MTTKDTRADVEKLAEKVRYWHSSVSSREAVSMLMRLLARAEAAEARNAVLVTQLKAANELIIEVSNDLIESSGGVERMVPYERHMFNHLRACSASIEAALAGDKEEG